MPPNNPLGYSFAPTFSNAELGKRGGSPPASSQQALQTLSFRLKPRIAGAPGSPTSLMGAGPQGSPISSAVLESVLRTVLGPDAAAMLSAGSPAAMAASSPVSQAVPSQFSPAPSASSEGRRAPGERHPLEMNLSTDPNHVRGPVRQQERDTGAGAIGAFEGRTPERTPDPNFVFQPPGSGERPGQPVSGHIPLPPPPPEWGGPQPAQPDFGDSDEDSFADFLRRERDLNRNNRPRFTDFPGY